MDVFGCFAVSNIVTQKKSKFVYKFILLKKGADLYGQFVSVAERERTCCIVIFWALWISLRVGFFVSLFIVCLTYLLADVGE